MEMLYRTFRMRLESISTHFVCSMMMPTHPITSSPVSDFKIGENTFEVGGKSKKQKQIRELQNAYVVKDDIEYGYRNIIPIWAFGLTY